MLGGWTCEGQSLNATPTLMPIHPQPQDLRDYVLQGSVRGCSALEGSVGLSNSVSRWVQVMVLSRPGPTQRAQVLDKFIHVAQVRPAPPSARFVGARTPSVPVVVLGNDNTVSWSCPVASCPILATPAQSPRPSLRSQSGGSYPDCDSPGSVALLSPHPTLPGPTPWS